MQMVDVSSIAKSSISANSVASPQTTAANQSKSFTFQGVSPKFSHGSQPFEKPGHAQKSGGPSSSSPASQKFAHAAAPVSDDVLKRRAAAAVEFGFIEAAVASGLPTGPPQLRPFELTRALLRWFWYGMRAFLSYWFAHVQCASSDGVSCGQCLPSIESQYCLSIIMLCVQTRFRAIDSPFVSYFFSNIPYFVLYASFLFAGV